MASCVPLLCQYCELSWQCAASELTGKQPHPTHLLVCWVLDLQINAHRQRNSYITISQARYSLELIRTTIPFDFRRGWTRCLHNLVLIEHNPTL